MGDVPLQPLLFLGHPADIGRGAAGLRHFGVNVIVMPYYINLSLFLAAACLIPEQRVLVFFIVPVKMRIMALVNLVLVVLELAQRYYLFHTALPAGLLVTMLCVAPVIALLNFLLFLRGTCAISRRASPDDGCASVTSFRRTRASPTRIAAAPSPAGRRSSRTPTGRKLPQRRRRKALSPQVHGLRAHGHELPRAGVPLLLEMQGLFLLLHRPYQQPYAHSIKDFPKQKEIRRNRTWQKPC